MSGAAKKKQKKTSLTGCVCHFGLVLLTGILTWMCIPLKKSDRMLLLLFGVVTVGFMADLGATA